MAFYYVKSGGTATGDAGRSATQLTGTFAAMGAANYYNNIDVVFNATTLPVDGDYVCCSSAHAFTQGSSYSIGLIGANVNFISVDDANAEQYLTGASEAVTSGTLSFRPANGDVVSFDGIDFSSEDDMIKGDEGSRIVFKNCTISAGTGAGSSGDNIRADVDGVSLDYVNVDFKISESTNGVMFAIERGVVVRVSGGSVLNNTTGPRYLCATTGNASGALMCHGVDFSNIDNMLINDGNSVLHDDNAIIELEECRMPVSWDFGDVLAAGISISVTNCDNGNNRYVSGEKTWFGSFLSNAVVSADNADSVEGASISLEVTTTSQTRFEAPYRVLIGAFYADFATSKTITVEIVHDAQGGGTGGLFQNSEAWVEVHKPDSASPKAIAEFSAMANSFATPADNASSAETWTGASMSTEVTEKLELTTTPGGGEGWAHVYAHFATPSINSGDLFVSPDIGVA